MIHLSDLDNLENFGLCFQDNVLKISPKCQEIIIVDKAIKIEVASRANVKILDMVCDGAIEVTIGSNANVQYQILSSKNVDRVFINSGNLEILEISLEQSKEKLSVKSISPYACVDVKVLAVAFNADIKFEQLIEHQAVNTTSNVYNLAVAMNNSDVLFATTGKIEKGMAKSICRQVSRGIVMDEMSVITAKPILLIDEYDVVANHGASIGKMSDESLFYLMSRGLSRHEAFILILEGIINPFITKIWSDDLKKLTDERLLAIIKG